MFNKVKEYLQISFPITHKQIVNVLDQTYNPTNPSLLKMVSQKKRLAESLDDKLVLQIPTALFASYDSFFCH